MERGGYVAALKVERATVERRPDGAPNRARRLAEIDAELDRYSDKPVEPQLEAPAKKTAAARRPRRRS